MARARNIKPGFFINEELAVLSFEIRLLFIGLWTLADREGRLEDRPSKIKLAIFPFDDVDVVAGLDALEASGLISRHFDSEEYLIQIFNPTQWFEVKLGYNVRHHANLRRARKMRATPKWADLKQIRRVYEQAAELSKGATKYHVDHIVPLKGKGVCGLHVHWNLEPIPAHENQKKGNKFNG